MEEYLTQGVLMGSPHMGSLDPGNTPPNSPGLGRSLPSCMEQTPLKGILTIEGATPRVTLM